MPRAYGRLFILQDGNSEGFFTASEANPRPEAGTCEGKKSVACCGLKQLFLDFELGFACGSALRDGGGEIVLAIEEIGELEAEIALVGGVGQADFDADDPGANHLLNLVIEVLHPFRLAVAHSVKERFS